jgi:hypothetical protein
MSLEQKFGSNENVGSGSTEIIWSYSGTYGGFVDTAETINITSTSAEDVSGLTGISEVIVYGLDANFRERSEVVVLNGVAVIPTVHQYRRVYRLKASGSVGSTGSNVGTITGTGATSGGVFIDIQPTFGQSQIAVYTVPHLQQAHVFWAAMGINSDLTAAAQTKAGEIQFWVRDFIEETQVHGPWRMLRRFNGRNDGSGNVTGLMGSPIVLPSRSDTKIVGRAQANNTAFYFEWHMLLVAEGF